MAVARLRFDEAPPADFRGGAVAVGNFDGVHRGHAALVGETRKLAREAGGPAVVVTFDPHPLTILAPERFQPPLMTSDERAKRLTEVGADHVAVLRTGPELLALTPDYFFETILDFGLGARAVVEGFNFRFGKDRAGDNALLGRLCAERGMTFREVPAFELDARPVSSSRVRDAVNAGDMAEARRLLGRPFRSAGSVGTGAKRGRTLGFPTANLDDVTTLLPPDGVYAVGASARGDWFGGAAHVGPNVTFGEGRRQVEVHLLDFSGDLYGEPLEVVWLRRLRGSMKFPGADALVEQMRLDVAEARSVVGKNLTPPAPLPS